MLGPNVRFGSFATDAFGASADQCPLYHQWRPIFAAQRNDAKCQKRPHAWQQTESISLSVRGNRDDPSRFDVQIIGADDDMHGLEPGKEATKIVGDPSFTKLVNRAIE
jgi:hypothetical protein